MCGAECLHTLCMFHLSRQLPRRRAESVGEWRKLADMFAGAARGTTSTCEGFMRALRLKGGGEGQVVQKACGGWEETASPRSAKA